MKLKENLFELNVFNEIKCNMLHLNNTCVYAQYM
jgi:hypothetical protein